MTRGSARGRAFFYGVRVFLLLCVSLTDQSTSCLVELPEKWICTVHSSSCELNKPRSQLRIPIPSKSGKREPHNEKAECRSTDGRRTRARWNVEHESRAEQCHVV